MVKWSGLETSNWARNLLKETLVLFSFYVGLGNKKILIFRYLFLMLYWTLTIYRNNQSFSNFVLPGGEVWLFSVNWTGFKTREDHWKLNTKHWNKLNGNFFGRRKKWFPIFATIIIMRNEKKKIKFFLDFIHETHR